MPRPAGSPESLALGKVTSGRRAPAMAGLREHRPDLDHTALIAVVDAAAMWTDADKDYLVPSLLRAAGGEEMAGAGVPGADRDRRAASARGARAV